MPKVSRAPPPSAAAAAAVAAIAVSTRRGAGFGGHDGAWYRARCNENI